jgi:acetoin utilization deacetylase AcuC-like enzyme
MWEYAITKLWPLTENYEYASELGLVIRGLAPGWWQEFERAQDLSRYPLPQAAGYAFLQFLEQSSELDDHELAEVLNSALQGSPLHMKVEVQASLDCLDNDYISAGDPFEPEELGGQDILLWAPGACIGYPDGKTLYLDEWTQKALDGANLLTMNAPEIDEHTLAGPHSPYYIQELLQFIEAGGGRLTPETFVTAEAGQAILAGAGAVVDAARKAVAGERRLSLCLVRPGSHHAARSRGGGTCLINNLAVAATDALNRGVHSVAIIDLDAHHGNGTEDIFREEPRVFTLSIHQQAPFFPGTGYAEEKGAGRGHGKNLNIPVSSEDNWLGQLELGLMQVQKHKPQLILVEYSTDAHRADPVSDLQLSDEDYKGAIQMIESLGAPVVYELGASLDERAWIGGLRALVRGAGR